MSIDPTRKVAVRDVLLFIRSLNVGGAQRQLVLLAKALQDAGIGVRVLTFYPGGQLAEELQVRGIPLMNLAKKGRWDILAFAFRLMRYVVKARPDVVYSFLPTANLFACLLKLLPASPRLVWGVRASYVDMRPYGILARMELALTVAGSRIADMILCNSEAGMTYHSGIGYPKRKMSVVSNGIDTTKFRFDAVERGILRAEWNVSEEAILIGLIARFDPMKDHETFFSMACEVRKHRSDVTFVCVGTGDTQYAALIRRRAIEMGLGSVVRWIDDGRDAAPLYSALDLFVSSSSSGEGFSNAVVEAMACERICIVTDVGDSRRIVGDVGVTVPPGDSAAMAAACLSTLKMSLDARRRMGEAARARAVAEFGIDRLVERTCIAIGATPSGAPR